MEVAKDAEEEEGAEEEEEEEGGIRAVEVVRSVDVMGDGVRGEELRKSVRSR